MYIQYIEGYVFCVVFVVVAVCVGRGGGGGGGSFPGLVTQLYVSFCVLTTTKTNIRQIFCL